MVLLLPWIRAGSCGERVSIRRRETRIGRRRGRPGRPITFEGNLATITNATFVATTSPIPIRISYVGSTHRYIGRRHIASGGCFLFQQTRFDFCLNKSKEKSICVFCHKL